MNAPPSIVLTFMAWKLAQSRTHIRSTFWATRTCSCPLCQEHFAILDRISDGEKP